MVIFCCDSSSSGLRVVRGSSVTGSGWVEGGVEVEVDMEGFRMFRNRDLKLKDRGLLGLLVVVALVMVLSLLENLDLFLKEEGFRDKDLMVDLGLGVVEVSSELEFS